MTDTPAAAVSETPATEVEFTPTETAGAPLSEEAQIAELRATYAKATGDETAATSVEETPAAAEEPEKAAAAEEPETPLAEVIAAPSHLPEDIQALWKDIPEAARPALERSYRSLGDRLAHQGRVVSAVKPSYDVLVRAAQEMPQLAEMTPAQIASEVFELAKISASFEADKVGTIVGWAQRAGVLDQVRAALTGEGAPTQQPTFDPRQFIGQINTELPAIVHRYVSDEMAKNSLVSEVQKFASAPENSLWAQVEGEIPTYLPKAIAKLGETASAQDKLKLAYDMAIHADPDLRAKASASIKKEPEPDPKKAEDAARAASINVTSRGASKPAVLTERQQLEAAYREAQRR